MGVLYEATFVMYSLGLAVGYVRQFSGRKTAKMYAFSAKSDLGIPFPAWLVQRDTKQPAGLVANWRAPLILLIGAVAGLSQICKTIVRPVAIHVVNLLQRPFPGHVKPCESVCLVRGSVAAHAPVSIAGIKAPGTFAVAATGATFCPCECAGFRAVVKKFAQTLRSKIGGSHAVVPLKQWIGQRPGSIRSRSRLRYFNGLHALLHEPSYR